EGDPNDDVSTYLSRENWTKINHAESYISSFPKNEFDQANIMPDYIIFEDENDRLLHKILGNPNDPRLPSSFQLIYSSPDGKNLVYKINK
ncbi:MAG: hypothetical protein VYD94_00745, partial [Thermoproteota archaeon]|nr:hypothetical protein [Thermoproteota archaeon]